MRPAIAARESVAAILCYVEGFSLLLKRFIPTGESFQPLSYTYKIAACTIGGILKEVCSVIWETLKPEFMTVPNTPEHWKQIAESFEDTWPFPNCCRSIDGKHIVMKAPARSGFVYYNYKGTSSIVLLAVVDACYKFVMIDVGSYWTNNDAGVFRNSRFGQVLRNGNLYLPLVRTLPRAGEFGPLPCLFITDEGLPLLRNLMIPHGGRGRNEEERIFNYRLSRARRIVESTFGILAARWRVFHSRKAVEPETAKSIVKAACVLHNNLQNSTTPTQQRRSGESESQQYHGRPMLLGADCFKSR